MIKIKETGSLRERKKNHMRFHDLEFVQCKTTLSFSHEETAKVPVEHMF